MSRNRPGALRRAVLVIAVCCATGCTPAPAPDRGASAAPVPPAGSTSLDCAAPIDTLPSPSTPYRDTLGVVGLDTASTLQVGGTGGTDPHHLFAKTGLLVRVGRASTVTVPVDWAARVSIAWGNHAAEWTTSLYIPACPPPPGGSGAWLVYPGGFSVDKAACVPLAVSAAGVTTTVYVSVGTRCR